jgi:hypothetical protein
MNRAKSFPAPGGHLSFGSLRELTAGEVEKNRPKSKWQVSVEHTWRRLNQFFEMYGSKFESPLNAQQAPPFGNVGRMLSKAIQVNEPGVYSFILQALLRKKGLKPPRGVFKLDLNRGHPGRKRKADEQFWVWHSYSKMKKPTFGQVAHEVFPKEFSENPKRAADRARQLYRSFEKRFPDATIRKAIWEFLSSEDPPGEKSSK